MRHSLIWERNRPKSAGQENKGNRLNIKEVMERIGCSRSSVYNLVSEGKLPAITLFESGKGIRIYETDVDCFLRERAEDI